MYFFYSTILIYSCIRVMFMLFFVSCHIFYRILIIFFVSYLILLNLVRTPKRKETKKNKLSRTHIKKHYHHLAQSFYFVGAFEIFLRKLTIRTMITILKRFSQFLFNSFKLNQKKNVQKLICGSKLNPEQEYFIPKEQFMTKTQF